MELSGPGNLGILFLNIEDEQLCLEDREKEVVGRLL